MNSLNPMKDDSNIIDIVPRKARPGHRRAGAFRTRQAPTILLMDDDLPARRALRRVLRARGWDVQCVAHPEEALLALSENVPDLLITDLSAGSVSGWDLLFHETLEHPSLPIIAVGALPAGEVYGADQIARAYFQKPLDLNRLVAAVRRCLEDNTVICIT